MNQPATEPSWFFDAPRKPVRQTATPVFFDRDASIERVAELTKEATSHDARLVAFSEAFVPTYPDWVWRTTPWSREATVRNKL